MHQRLDQLVNRERLEINAHRRRVTRCYILDGMTLLDVHIAFLKSLRSKNYEFSSCLSKLPHNPSPPAGKSLFIAIYIFNLLSKKKNI